MKKVFVIGGVSYDMIIHLNEFPKPIPQTIHHCDSVIEAVGSTGTGKAAALAKLGFDVTLQGLMGEDLYGEKVKGFCKEHNIQYMYDIDPKGTDRHVNIMNSCGQRISMFIAETSQEPDMDYTKYEKVIAESDYVVLNIINYCRHFIDIIKKHKKEIWCDLHDYNEGNSYHEDFIEAADYIFLSSDNLQDYKAVMTDFINRGKKLVVCTHGKEGVTALTTEGEWIDMPAMLVDEVVDTNGAGDNFFSGFLYGYANDCAIEECVKYGTAAGAMCVQSSELVHKDLSIPMLQKQIPIQSR
ncbi:carbohydrate kinase family protein [Bacillus sp. HMF5848]|uniref:carbohydrate kinase family protein n=1 Tax=Bacillus sp. HMF5848 TaxID=2495421 RepID=UPI000F76FBA0|nr:PfkB family carbohydrate kinase [Bacillus sp. HMF5848]RSK25966.1 carbohydrate kinase family protein [Bacillus sp. HMF5848]